MEGVVGMGLERNLKSRELGMSQPVEDKQLRAQQVVMRGFRTETFPQGAGLEASS